ncbi:MAG: tetraacyldisaccharide 4'-kinase [Acidobacteriota bacterium]|nr:tetraacyldisaccharide 4'-kinase [Acidobacteriota bacterium]
MVNDETFQFTIHHLPFTIMLSRLYGSITNFRNALYERGVFRSVSLGVPVISVGNITVGGTGKTPLVALIAEMSLAKDERVGILTRGYGRENPKRRVLVSDGERILATAKSAGDEPFELARKLRGKAVIVADADRAAAGIWARNEFNITTFILDDAFQHRRVRRDTDLVLIDATNPFGSGKTLPFGILREPLENLKRADAIIITRVNLAESIENIKTRIRKYNPDCPIYAAENRISNLTELREFSEAEPKTKNQEPKTKNRFFAFCALGNPSNFYEQMRRENFNLVSTRDFPDHHFYTANDVRELTNQARNAGAEILLTTAKDAVKLSDFDFQMPCSVVETELIFDQEFKI